MNERLPMPATMPAELAEKLSDQYHHTPPVTEARLDDQIGIAIEHRWDTSELLRPCEWEDLWQAKFWKALQEAVLHQDTMRYAALGKLVHMMARESVREEL